MMDLSHGSIMQESEIERQIDFLARWKANQYYFYSEASIELKGYPLLNRRGRYSQVCAIPGPRRSSGGDRR
jgi:hypothetical protein